MPKVATIRLAVLEGYVKLRADVNRNNISLKLIFTLYTMVLVTFFVSNSPSEVVSMCRRGFYIPDAVFSEWHYGSQR